MEQFGFQGMRVFQFAFNCCEGDRFLPHNYPRACVVYAGTHDNDALVGWLTGSSTDAERRDALRYYLCGNANNWAFVRAAWMSVADTALITMQDLPGLGSEARMNLPGTSGTHN
ncbi:MAG: 4-alpha-glucanotransferase [Roseiflexus sp.]|jgi:4-alpha-glucanotransferase|nr:4-alpha-glucanotransferase [Roseiflexus sp.]MBO9334184.1 4-alpha-glucanotransferase [Roseiflexus sp.]MBO9365803.1 4-alpha-glucanotransferase [Roseiflexus sp.]MBO9389396.1 4-alpha-glucanotransferase [Roseiflexus sp.]